MSPTGPVQVAATDDCTAEACSPAWSAGAPPAASVVISSYGRSGYLADVVACLEAQSLPLDTWEAVIVDNGSGDDTWAVLTALVAATPVRLHAVRLGGNHGPGGGRNAGVARSRGAIIAFTDDDCLPTPTWLAKILDAFARNVEVVQGCVEPDPDGLVGAGPWDHKIDIGGMTPWFETSNVAYRRAAFEAVSGFDEHDELTSQKGGGRAFGEDAVLAARVLALGGQARFARASVVRHRVVPGSYRRQIREARYIVGFPGLVRRSAIAHDSLRANVFLNEQSALFDLAVAATVAAVATRRPLLLVGILPWVRRHLPWARRNPVGRLGAPGALVARAGAEAVGLASLVEGSVRHRRLVL